MSNIRLGQRRADTLKPRKKAYDIRDGELKGFGLRVLPSGKKRYFVHSQHRGRERFLSPEEWRRLSAVLARHEAGWALHAALVRLLLLTGCRKGEFLTLRWTCYREGKLFLPDSKTGARTVWLCAAARGVLDGLPRTASWVFPTRQGNRPLPSIDRFWQRVRAEADLHDVRLHDLRHTCASLLYSLAA